MRGVEQKVEWEWEGVKRGEKEKSIANKRNLKAMVWDGARGKWV